MILAQYFDVFMLFSFVGWIYECIYCTFTKKRWDNRGFLFGPICPIYGVGVVLCVFIFNHIPTFSCQSPFWKIFLVTAIGSAILEFTTSWVLEYFFHTIWWDYSKVPLNIQGRICLPVTCAFGIAGIFVVHFVVPFIVSLQYSAHPLVYEGVAIVLAAYLGIDFGLSIENLVSLVAKMEKAQQEFDQKMQNGYELLQQGPSAVVAAAGTAAKNAAMNAEQEMTGRMTDFLSNLSIRERYYIKNVIRFRGRGKKKTMPFAEKLKENFYLLQGTIEKIDFRKKEDEEEL